MRIKNGKGKNISKILSYNFENLSLRNSGGGHWSPRDEIFVTSTLFKIIYRKEKIVMRSI